MRVPARRAVTGAFGGGPHASRGGATLIEIRAYEPGMREDVIRFAAAYGLAWGRDPELFSWKHERPPLAAWHDAWPRLWVACAGGRVVGVLGNQPAYLRFQGQTIRGAVAVDLHVAPSDRRRGIARRLLDELDQVSDLVLAPEAARLANRIFLRRGYRPIDGLEMPIHVLRPLRATTRMLLARVAPPASGRPALSRMALELASLVPGCHAETGSPPEGADAFLAACRDRHELAVVRDWEHLSYQYLEHPYGIGALFTVRGDDGGILAVFAVARKRMRRLDALVLGDLYAADEEGAVARAVRAALPAMGRAAGADVCAVLALSPFLKRVPGTFVRRHRLSIGLRGALAGAPLDPSRWYLTAGDSDVLA